MKPGQWLGRGIEGSEVREGSGTAGAAAVKGPRNVPDVPRARQPPIPSHTHGFFPKENAPRGLKGAGKTPSGSILSWGKAPHAVSNDTAPLGWVLLGKKLPIFFLKAQNSGLRSLCGSSALTGRLGGFCSSSAHGQLRAPFCWKTKASIFGKEPRSMQPPLTLIKVSLYHEPTPRSRF